MLLETKIMILCIVTVAAYLIPTTVHVHYDGCSKAFYYKILLLIELGALLRCSKFHRKCVAWESVWITISCHFEVIFMYTRSIVIMHVYLVILVSTYVYYWILFLKTLSRLTSCLIIFHRCCEMFYNMLYHLFLQDIVLFDLLFLVWMK